MSVEFTGEPERIEFNYVDLSKFVKKVDMTETTPKPKMNAEDFKRWMAARIVEDGLYNSYRRCLVN